MNIFIFWLGFGVLQEVFYTLPTALEVILLKLKDGKVTLSQQQGEIISDSDVQITCRKYTQSLLEYQEKNRGHLQ